MGAHAGRPDAFDLRQAGTRRVGGSLRWAATRPLHVWQARQESVARGSKTTFLRQLGPGLSWRYPHPLPAGRNESCGPFHSMIRLTRCTQAGKAGTYFRLHLQAGDSPTHPAAPGLTLKPSWVGSALPDVKLAAFTPPTASHLVRLGRGLHPTEKKRLAPAKNRKRAYYDLTISTAKTISLCALLEPNHPVAKCVMHAHMEAVEAVARAAGKMIEPQNARGAAMDKWLGVLFHHTHTRENDPHLHSHLILPNVMLNRDGQWRALQVVIAGPNRLKLQLLYGHHLATHLRRLGFGPELAMRRNGLPEIRALQPLVRTFSKARTAVVTAARAAEAERPPEPVAAGGRVADDSKAAMHPRSQLPLHPDQAALRRRQRLADRMRKPKAKTADDPVKLTHEAERWQREVSNQDYRRLMTLLDDLDHTSSRRQAVLVREGSPPPLRDLLQAAARNIPEGVKFTGPVLFREAVVLSAGRHPWAELLAETKAKVARRKKALARIRAEWETVSVAQAQAEIEAANRAHAARQSVRRPATATTAHPPATATTAPPPPKPLDAAMAPDPAPTRVSAAAPLSEVIPSPIPAPARRGKGRGR